MKDLPQDLPSFLAQFGTDAQCRAYLVRARWPDGFRCDACGHDRAWSHHRPLVEECRACGKQHSILKGTLFEQTKTGLARWFLAIDLARLWGEADQRLPAIHLVFGLAKRWLLGTHHGAVSGKYLQRYLDEYVIRFDRHRAKSPAHGFARVLQHAVRLPPATHRKIVAAGAT